MGSMDGLNAWADDELGMEPEVSAQPPAEDELPIPPGSELLTVADLLQTDDLPPSVKEWLEQYATQGDAWAEANDPPVWVADGPCWDKAKGVAEQVGAIDPWAFMVWWYVNHTGCAVM